MTAELLSTKLHQPDPSEGWIEQAVPFARFLLSLSYDFSEIGVERLSTIVTFVEGWDGGPRGHARTLANST